VAHRRYVTSFDISNPDRALEHFQFDDFVSGMCLLNSTKEIGFDCNDQDLDDNSSLKKNPASPELSPSKITTNEAQEA